MDSVRYIGQHLQTIKMDCILKILAAFIMWTYVCCKNVSGEESALCPPQKLILPCRCAQKMNEIQLWYVNTISNVQFLYFIVVLFSTK